jgi:outer membrane lipoprotein-sorting protein
MKKIILITALIFTTVTLSGCIQQFRYKIKEVQSDVFGLSREVTIYSLDGKPFKTINGKFKILYPSNNRMEFVKEDGRKITVAGYYSAVIEEK